MTDEPENKTVRAVNRDTTITFGAALAIIVGLLASYDRLVSLEHQVDGLKTVIESAASDRWTQTEQHYYSLLLEERIREHHPGFTAPVVPLSE